MCELIAMSIVISIAILSISWVITILMKCHYSLKQILILKENLRLQDALGNVINPPISPGNSGPYH